MKKTVHELRKNQRVQAVREKIAAAPRKVSPEDNINVPQCFHCGALLPHDTQFQELHMKTVHGLVV